MQRAAIAWLWTGMLLGLLASSGCEFQTPATDQTDPLPRVFGKMPLPDITTEPGESASEQQTARAKQPGEVKQPDGNDSSQERSSSEGSGRRQIESKESRQERQSNIGGKQQ